MMAVIAGGIVAGMGRQGTFDPLNPVDIGAIDPVPEPYFNPFSGPDCSAITQAKEFTLPMTMHQRIYQWPETGIGPVNTPSGVSLANVPKEIPAGQAEFAFPIIPLCCFYSIDGTGPALPRRGLDTETVIPPRGGRLRAQWTVYQTAPWTVNPPIVQAGDSKSYVITGTTYDRLGTTPVAGCRVLALSIDRLRKGSRDTVVDDTVSDGSGNYSLTVTGRAVQILAYLPGTPDRAGVSRNDIVEQLTSIHMRDPTVADTPSGGSGGVSRGRIVNASS
jgi:hypothetical protein